MEFPARLFSYRSISDLSHDPELAAALGNAIVAWAEAERMILATLARVMGIGLNNVQPGFYRIPTFEARVKFARALMTAWDAGKFDKAAIDKQLVTLNRLASTRNHLIHGDWAAKMDLSQTVIFDHRSDASSPKRRKPIKAHDVRNHTNAVLACRKRLDELIDFDSIPLWIAAP